MALKFLDADLQTVGHCTDFQATIVRSDFPEGAQYAVVCNYAEPSREAWVEVAYAYTPANIHSRLAQLGQRITALQSLVGALSTASASGSTSIDGAATTTSTHAFENGRRFRLLTAADLEAYGGSSVGEWGAEGTVYHIPCECRGGHVKVAFDFQLPRGMRLGDGSWVNFVNIGGYPLAGTGHSLVIQARSEGNEGHVGDTTLEALWNEQRSVLSLKTWQHPYEDAFLGTIAFTLKAPEGASGLRATITAEGLKVEDGQGGEWSQAFAGQDNLLSWLTALSASHPDYEVAVYDVHGLTTTDLVRVSAVDITDYPLAARTLDRCSHRLELILDGDNQEMPIQAFLDGSPLTGVNTITMAEEGFFEQTALSVGGEGFTISNIEIDYQSVGKSEPTVVVIMLHSLRPDSWTDELGMWTTPARVRAMVADLEAMGYRNIGMEELERYLLGAAALESNAYLIIHDDYPYLNQEPLPEEMEALRAFYLRKGIKAAFAIIPAQLTDGEAASMKQDEGLFSYGIHGYNHEVWSGLTYSEARRLLSQAIALYREKMGHHPPFFVYPENAYGWRTLTNLMETSSISMCFANNTAVAGYGVSRSTCRYALSRIDGAEWPVEIEGRPTDAT